MARRISDRIRLLRLELVETDLPSADSGDGYLDEERNGAIEAQAAHQFPEESGDSGFDESVVLRWMLEIILADSAEWDAEELYTQLLSEGKRITWH